MKQNTKDIRPRVRRATSATDWISTIITIPPTESLHNYSYTVELYDLIPKYAWSNQTSPDGRLPIIERVFEHRKVTFTIAITPARLLGDNGTSCDRLPGKTEELVEDVLRKFVAEGRGIASGDRIGVKFTLYEVVQELKRVGHTRSLDEVKTALSVMAGCSLHITGRSENGAKIDIRSSLIGPLYLASRDDWEALGKSEQCYIEFHPLVSSSANSGQIRLVNYEACMRYKNILSKYIHKRMSHNFKQASEEKPYTIGITKLVLESGLSPKKYPSKTMSQIVEKALNEMISAGTIEKFEVEKKLAENGVVVDVFISIYPTKSFSQDIKMANFWQKGLIERIAKKDQHVLPSSEDM